MSEIWNKGLFIKHFATNLDDGIEIDVRIVVLCAILCAVVAYLIGSINFSVIISKTYGADVREKGSGNAGTTNMFRVYGKKAGICTFLADILKTVIVLVLGRLILGLLGAYVAGLFCIIGHAYPLFFKFKGGKGVVCMATMILMTAPLVFLIMFVIFFIILFGFKMVSLASVMCALIYPLILSNMAHFEGFFAINILIAMLCSVLVIFLHRKNIVRIFNHEESKISIGRKKGGNDEKRQK